VQLSFLFWNLQRKPLAHRIARLAQHESLDFIALAENQIPDDELLGELKAATGADFERPEPDPTAPEGRRKVDLFVRAGVAHVSEQRVTPRMVIYQVRAPECPLFLLAVAHLADPINNDKEARYGKATRVSQSLQLSERRTGIERTVLVGDLNMNPYDSGVLGAFGLHGVMTREIAARGARVVEGESCPFFYNPMWGLLGDRTPGPAGTIYYGNDINTSYWSLFDQVLLRPALMNSLQEVRILTTDGQGLFLTSSGRPDKANSSDHLPVKFGLEM
jgi:hypothetical protein